jgi:hypothetical protein
MKEELASKKLKTGIEIHPLGSSYSGEEMMTAFNVILGQFVQDLLTGTENGS